MSENSRCLVVGAANSGSGKTTVALALTLALRRRGVRVRAAKTGPDFIDARYLALASGAPAYNFDSWLTGGDHVLALASRLSSEADILIVEGVMGLYDGASPDSLDGSTAEIALILGAPTVLAVNVRGMSRSLAALVRGYAGFAPGLRLEGVIANFAGGERHAAILRRALASSGGPPLLGAAARGDFPGLPEKRYGLRGDLDEPTRDALADAAERVLDIDRILEIAAEWRPTPILAPEDRPFPAGVRLGIPFDEAFHFYYQDDLELLERSGVKIVRFSPLEDAQLPPVLDGLYWGGGLAEDFIPRLSENRSLMAEVAAFAESGRPVVACGNALAYFAAEYHAADGPSERMAGVYPGAYRSKRAMHRLGYAEIEPLVDTPLGTAGSGTGWRAHEFSYGALDAPADESWAPAYRALWRSGQTTGDGWARDNILLSPAHPRLAGRHGAASSLVRAIFAKKEQ